MDFDGIATAIAARFAPAQVTPPAGGYDNIRVSTADLPGQMTPLPTVLVFLDGGDFYPGGKHIGGKRDSNHRFTVRFYYNQTGDPTRDSKALRLWLAILVDQLKNSLQLNGAVAGVTGVRVVSYEVGLVKDFAGQVYSGFDMTVEVNVNEAWQAVS